MPTKTWKNKESQVARFFGSERTPLSGGNSKHTRSDSLHEKFFIECKYRIKQAIWTLYKETDELSADEGKTTILASCQKGEQGFLVVVHNEDFEKVAVDFLKQRGFSVRKKNDSV